MKINNILLLVQIIKNYHLSDIKIYKIYYVIMNRLLNNKHINENIYNDINLIKRWLLNEEMLVDFNTTLDLYNIIQICICSDLQLSIKANKINTLFLNLLEKYNNIDNLLKIDFSDISITYITDIKDLSMIQSIIIENQSDIICNTCYLPSYINLIKMIETCFFPLDILSILYNRYKNEIVTELLKKYLLIELMKKYELNYRTKKAHTRILNVHNSSRSLQEVNIVNMTRLNLDRISLNLDRTSLIKDKQKTQYRELERVSVNANETLIKNIMVEINKIMNDDLTKNIQYMFKKVNYIILSSELTTRNIDILLHYVTRDEQENKTHEINIINFLQKLSIEFIISIFNDPTVQYPYSSRKSYLNKIKTAPMSSILVSQFIHIYHYILINYPLIEVDSVTDLKLILNQLLAIGLQEIPQIHMYRDIIINLKQRLPERNLFLNNKWFDMLLDALKIALLYVKDVAIERTNSFTSNMFFYNIRHMDSWKRSKYNNPKREFDLIELFKNYNSWETYMIVDTNDINFLDQNGHINETLINYIRHLLNDDNNEHRNKQVKI